MNKKPPAFSFADISVPQEGVVVILAEEGGTLSPTGKKLDKAPERVITRATGINGFTGKKKS
ncbi:MAG: hypothetical protein OEM91_12755, partial [Hyphomicrobiales bacterium]|nr:hypothetical protein [Hyphomicrobiales bacterium]